MKKITLVVPIYNEQKNIVPFWESIQKFIHELPFIFEICMVDDGSVDGSKNEIIKLANKNPNLIYIILSKNFGKEKAISAAIDHICSDAVIIMDADLQHPARYIPDMVNQWMKGFDIVIMKRNYVRKPDLVKRLGSFAFYKIMNAISDTKMVANTTDFRLIDNKVLNVFRQMTERNRLLRGMIDWIGFEKCFLEFDADERLHGEAAYSFSKLLSLAINSFTSFSLFPLKVAGYSGIVLFLSFTFLLFYMLFDKLVFNFWGFTNLAFVVVINSLMMSFVLVCLGLITLYIGSIYIEVQNRPLYIVANSNINLLNSKEAEKEYEI